MDTEEGVAEEVEEAGVEVEAEEDVVVDVATEEEGQVDVVEAAEVATTGKMPSCCIYVHPC